jgi:predicted DsbA family dithiol-disulfide isomerase
MPNSSINETVEIIEFTDPVCTWCWGSEPVLRKLETRYGKQVRIKYLMGGLVKNITSFYDRFNDIGGDPTRSNANIAKHWLEASTEHGMPVRTEDFALFSTEYPSSYPLNVAYKAAQLSDPALANRFLRRMREASAAEAKLTNRIEVLAALAHDAGLHVDLFLQHFADGSAQRAFEEDLAIVTRYRVRSFPTFLVRFGKKEELIPDFAHYDEFRAIVTRLTDGEIVERVAPADEANITAFIAQYGSIAPIELMMTFDLTNRQTNSIIESLLTKRAISRSEAGNGYFLTPRIQRPARVPTSRTRVTGDTRSPYLLKYFR